MNRPSGDTWGERTNRVTGPSLRTGSSSASCSVWLSAASVVTIASGRRLGVGYQLPPGADTARVAFAPVGSTARTSNAFSSPADT